jgi:hypothetical protein
MNYKFKLEDYFLSSLPFNSDNKFEAKKNIDTKTELLTNPLFNKFDINDFLLLGEKIKNYDTQELNDFFKIKISDLYIYAISINDIKLFSNLLILRGGRSILFKIFKYYIDPLKEKINKDEYINFTKERKELMFNIYINYIHPSNFFNLLSKTTGLSYLETRELYGEKDSFKKIIA